MISISGSWQLFSFLATFGLAGVVCAIAARRARKVEDAETSRGLVALLATTSMWSLLQAGIVLVRDQPAAYAIYVLSLVIGLATVGAWLYFCSAYTGRSFHRNPTYRHAAVAAYLVVVVVKLTNPIHGLYFTAEFVTMPFPHLSIRHEILHWVVSGIAYSLATVGLFMLYETFLETDYDTRALAGLAATTALPVVFDIIGFTSSALLDFNYEPLGVAVFAVGTLYVFEDRFFAVQLAEGVEDPVVHLDADGRIREVDEQARDRFPVLADAVGESLAEVFPAAAERLDSGNPILEWTTDGDTRYYLVNEVSAALAQTAIARTVVFTDITEVETRRQELERHNTQLEGFAAAIRHNMLNTLQVVKGNLGVANESLDEGDVHRARESLTTASQASDEMVATVGELATLARNGQTVEELRPVQLAEAAEDAFDDVDPDDLSLSVEGGSIQADGRRLRELLKRAFEFARHDDATTVTVTQRDDGFAIAGDGTPLTDVDDELFFEYGTATTGSTTGMALPNLRMLARTHAWEVAVDTEYETGFRFVVSGAVTEKTPSVSTDQ